MKYAQIDGDALCDYPSKRVFVIKHSRHSGERACSTLASDLLRRDVGLICLGSVGAEKLHTLRDCRAPVQRSAATTFAFTCLRSPALRCINVLASRALAAMSSIHTDAADVRTWTKFAEVKLNSE